MLMACLIGLIGVSLFPYACFDTKEHESPSANHGSFHSYILNTRRLICLGRTGAKSLCAPRMGVAKFLFEALCVRPKFSGFQVSASSTLLPNRTPTSQAHVKNLSKTFQHDF